MTIHSTGLCLPDKGNVGQILTTLAFLFCCDECRQAIDGNVNYTTFSVRLENWINDSFGKCSSFGSSGKRKRDASGTQLNFHPILSRLHAVTMEWVGRSSLSGKSL
jgi:hypothetical protein